MGASDCKYKSANNLQGYDWYMRIRIRMNILFPILSLLELKRIWWFCILVFNCIRAYENKYIFIFISTLSNNKNDNGKKKKKIDTHIHCLK